MTTLFLVTACSELRIIGSAAVRELRADGINVERARTASINTASNIRWDDCAASTPDGQARKV